ncbi:MAG: ubiquinol-cytochrome C chaperone family protein, partial [Methyloceanibacter sp.]
PGPGGRLEQQSRILNPLDPLTPWRRSDTSAAKLYGAIVAQARLPVFYQGFGVPDTLKGRFLMLSLHLFAVLHRLKGEGPAAVGLAQELSDRFSADMETVLREIGVGDLSIPKKMRGLAASNAALLQAYEEALAAGNAAVAAVIAIVLPLEPGATETTSGRLAHYLKGVVRQLEAQSFAALEGGEVRFPGIAPGEALGDALHE